VSQENVEQFIHRMYEAFNAEGVAAVADDFFAAEVEYDDDAVWPGGGTHHGRQAVAARFDEVITVLGITQAVVERVVDSGPESAWVIRAVGHSPGASVPHDHRWGYVGRIAGGKLVYFRAYYDPEQALKAVGLEK
jgi:ketosteroid isomerase-like protein